MAAPTRSSSIVLLSGGLDSFMSFHWAHEESDIMLGLTLDYGQRSAAREIASAAAICKKNDIPHRVIELGWYKSLKANPLTDANIPLPELKIKDLNTVSLTEQSAKAVWIPNRNGVFLNVAASLAEDSLANWIIVGFNKEEAQTFPDNSEAFIKASDQFFKFSTSTKVQVKAPMASLTKKEIVQWGLKRDLDFSMIWSCYKGDEKMCGACESCLRLKRGLNEGGGESWLARLF